MQNTTCVSLAMSVAALFAAACDKGAPEAGGATTGAEGRENAADVPKSGATDMPAAPPAGSGDVQCLGIHECKGKSACHVSGGHACAGQNECKGKGWISVPREECDAKGGKVISS